MQKVQVGRDESIGDGVAVDVLHRDGEGQPLWGHPTASFVRDHLPHQAKMN